MKKTATAKPAAPAEQPTRTAYDILVDSARFFDQRATRLMELLDEASADPERQDEAAEIATQVVDARKLAAESAAQAARSGAEAKPPEKPELVDFGRMDQVEACATYRRLMQTDAPFRLIDDEIEALATRLARSISNHRRGAAREREELAKAVLDLFENRRNKPAEKIVAQEAPAEDEGEPIEPEPESPPVTDPAPEAPSPVPLETPAEVVAAPAARPTPRPRPLKMTRYETEERRIAGPQRLSSPKSPETPDLSRQGACR